jgi:hypothetical protein
VCHVPPQKFLLFLNMLEKNAARLVRKAGLGSTAQSGLPDWINTGLEAALPRFANGIKNQRCQSTLRPA